MDVEQESEFNVAELFKIFSQKSQQIASIFLESDMFRKKMDGRNIEHIIEAYQQFYSALMLTPGVLSKAQIAYWQELLQLLGDVSKQWFSSADEAHDKQHQLIPDKRFTSEAWTSHPLFNFISQSYLLLSKHTKQVIDDVDNVDHRTAKKIAFYTERTLDALSPSNFLLTNPDVIEETIKTKGQNLISGLDNLLDDLTRAEKAFQIKMTDVDAFEVGRNVATTPGNVIYQNELMQLIQYTPQTTTVYQQPLLIIPPWINKFYILDLSEKNSFVRFCLAQGIAVYMISWVNPNESHREIDFSDYMKQGPLAAIDVICKQQSVKKVNTLGFCIGGTLQAATLAYMAKKNDLRVSSATYLASMIDFSDPGDMSIFIDDAQISHLEEEMNKKGYLDGSYMGGSFNLLRANDLIWSYYVKNYLKGETPFPFDILFWNQDATNMPAKMHSTYLRKMYLENQLIEPDGIEVDGIGLDVGEIKTPVFFISTEKDHIAPWQTTYYGYLSHGGEKEFVLGESGHIAGIINPPGKKKYGYYTNPTTQRRASTWLSKAQYNEDSWWLHWSKWLSKHSGKKVKPKTKQPYPPLEAAPGSYVK